MSEMDAIINNYDEKKYKEESKTPYETSSPPTEPTYHKESEPSTTEFYPKPSSEYPIVTPGETYYGKNDENSVWIYPYLKKIKINSWQYRLIIMRSS